MPPKRKALEREGWWWRRGVREEEKGSQLLESNQFGSYFYYILTCKIKLHGSAVFVLLIFRDWS